MKKAAEGAPERLRLGWYQAVVPHYRASVVNRLAATPGLMLTVFAGQPLAGITHEDASPTLSCNVVRIRNVWPRRRRLPFAYAHGWTRMLTTRQSVIITSESTRDVVNWLLLALCRLFGTRLVVLGHIRLTRHEAKHVAPLRRLMVRAADGVMAYTDEGVRQALEWGVAPACVGAIGNTLDLDRVARAKKSLDHDRVARLREAHRLDGLVLLFIGRPTPWKRLDVAIDAVRCLRQRGLSAHLLVVGTGASIQHYVARAVGLEYVHFLGGITDEDDLATVFAATDVVVIPGAVGLAVNHAFAYGVPLVTSRSAPHGPEMAIAEHDRNALLVEHCTPEAFADALQGFAASQEQRSTLRVGVAATAVPTIESMVASIVSIATRVATRR